MTQTELILTPQREWTQSELLARARHLLRSIGCLELAELVNVDWNPRLRSTAGTANYRHWLVQLNPRLRELGEVEATLRHELAHLVAKYRAGRRRIDPHGEEWRRACRDLGLPDERSCHNLPLPRRKVVHRYLYLCPACHTEIKRVRPFRRRVACLACCRHNSKGAYDERFRLILKKPRS